MTATKTLTTDQVIRWSGMAIRALVADGTPVNPKEFRKSLRRLVAPFRTESVLTTHGYTWFDVKQHFVDNLPLPEAKDVTAIGTFGLHTPNGDFVDPNEIWRRLSENTAKKMSDIASTKYQSIAVPGNRPVGIILMGDMHIGSSACNMKRIEWVEQQAARTDIDIYLIQIGDIIDNMFLPWARFELAKQMSTIPEQIYAAARFLNNVTQKRENGTKPLIGVCAGNHDLWSEKKTGVSFLDYAFSLAGTGNFPYNELELVLTVDLNGIEYSFVLRHKVRGMSQYNPAHGVIRWHLFHDKYERADAVVVGHTHQSGYDTRFFKGQECHGFQLGAYKMSEGDSYAVEQGFPNNNVHPDMLAIIHPDRKKIEGFADTNIGLSRLEYLNGVNTLFQNK